jgi:ABC-type transporter Mla MlaB component
MSVDPHGAPLFTLDVDGLRADAVTVDALARLALSMKRSGVRLRLEAVPEPLRELIELMGLTDVLCE